MRENRVGLWEASWDLGVDDKVLAAAFGYQDPLLADIRSGLTFAECIDIRVRVQGSAEDIGLTEEALHPFINLRRANDMAFIPWCITSPQDGQLLLSFIVWTVGDSFPVAFHVSASTHLWAAPDGVGNAPYSRSFLSYNAAPNVQEDVRAMISIVIEELAMEILKFR